MIISRLHVIRSLLLSLPFLSNPIYAGPTEWEIDKEHFSITFAVDHIGFQKQLGLFLEASGTFNYDPETQILETGRVEVQAKSIFSNNDDRDDHVRGRDFLDARRNPVIVFEATEYSADTAMQGQVMGNLTLLGETHPVTLEITINKQAKYPFGHRKETLGVSAYTTIQRSLWGMDYGVGNQLVGDDVTLQFEFEAVAQ